jgi:hypothetical protein
MSRLKMAGARRLLSYIPSWHSQWQLYLITACRKHYEVLLMPIYAVTNTCDVFSNVLSTQISCTGTNRKRLLVIGAPWFVSGNTWHLYVFITQYQGQELFVQHLFPLEQNLDSINTWPAGNNTPLWWNDVRASSWSTVYKQEACFCAAISAPYIRLV